MTFEEKTIDSELIYKGAILNLRKDKVTTINGEGYREIIEHNGASAIIAITDDNKVIMVKQYRKPAKGIVLEVPAGKRDGDEDFELTAIRELREETGYDAGQVIFLGEMLPSPGYSEEVIYLYMARNLTKGETAFDDNEAIDIYEYPIDDLYKMVMDGEITDAKTQITILKAMEVLRNE